MRDIVATIQPEQDELVRAALEDSICVQGAPGTGNPNPGNRHTAGPTGSDEGGILTTANSPCLPSVGSTNCL